jgi:hypothetical protein
MSKVMAQATRAPPGQGTGLLIKGSLLPVYRGQMLEL